ncbi:MAG: hypothetical protein ABSF10_04540 [Verrucomicrobiota bacterium]|jgi:hypothetical protein
MKFLEHPQMKLQIITTIETTTTEPYTQSPCDRIELQEAAGMIFLPKIAELQKMHPNFCERLARYGVHLRADPAQLDAPLLRELRNKVGIRIETDDTTQLAALLNLDETDPVFNGGHTQTKPQPQLPQPPPTCWPDDRI